MRNTLPLRLHLFSIILLFLELAQATVVTITVQAPLPTNEPSFTKHSQLTSAILNSTNTYRTRYNATSVSWNSTLADYASGYLSSARCKFAHSGGPYGENLAEGYPNASASVEAWGDEAAKYSWRRPGFSEDTGHFTQLVWKNTTDVGCAARWCGGDEGGFGWYLVCEYWPRGNVIGQFKQEVGREVKGSAAPGGGPPGWASLAGLGVVWLLKEMMQLERHEAGQDG